MLENYKFKFRARGKFIFVPNERCVRKGERILAFIKKRAKLPDYFYHYQPGGHVAALHSHVPHTLFFKIDIQNFFYSITRERVTRALREYGLQGAHTFARWSCVANPLPGPQFVLPIGFVQSPLLASLVLMRSPVADAIERAKSLGVTISVYLDDIVGSHNDLGVLTAAYDDIRQACATSNLIPNPGKLVSPAAAIVVFNCDLTHGHALVTVDRLAEFLAVPHTDASRQAFDQYRSRVAAANG
jgi:hypothetical protein